MSLRVHVLKVIQEIHLYSVIRKIRQRKLDLVNHRLVVQTVFAGKTGNWRLVNAYQTTEELRQTVDRNARLAVSAHQIALAIE